MKITLKISLHCSGLWLCHHWGFLGFGLLWYSEVSLNLTILRSLLATEEPKLEPKTKQYM